MDEVDVGELAANKRTNGGHCYKKQGGREKRGHKHLQKMLSASKAETFLPGATFAADGVGALPGDTLNRRFRNGYTPVMKISLPSPPRLI